MGFVSTVFLHYAWERSPSLTRLFPLLLAVVDFALLHLVPRFAAASNLTHATSLAEGQHRLTCTFTWTSSCRPLVLRIYI